jgi:hypothetical protein
MNSLIAEGLSAFAVSVDAERNLLTIRYRGLVGLEDVALCAVAATKAVENLRPGFRLLVDLTELETMDVAAAPQLAKIMELCDRRRVALVVRIIPNPQRDIGLQILSYFHYGAEVRVVTCGSFQEARLALEDSSRS